MAVQWTKEQEQAIDTKGGSLLVSAAAGSGKTAVLSERVVRLITDKENPVDADSMLIVTFTRLAAAEMKQRISHKLGAMLEAEPSNRALRRQQMLLESARISTIDSFCQSVVRDNFQMLDLPYDFRVADEKELELIRADAIKETIENYYSHDDGRFSSLIELLSGSRSDLKAEETIIRLYDFIRSHPFYEDWLEEKLNLYNPSIPPEQSPWGQIIMEYAADGIEYAISLVNQALEIITDDDQLAKAYLDAYRIDLIRLTSLKNTLENGLWDEILQQLAVFEFEKLGRLVKYPDTAKKDRVTGIRDKIKDIVKELREKRFCCTSQEYISDIAALRPDIELLFEVTQEFGRQLEKIKLSKKILDFPDLTHYALKLLVAKNSDGEPVQTEIALELSRKFSSVLVDEYQDTNEAQDMLFWAVSDKGTKLFVVGDVKQSIYRFRQAMPEIFLKKKESFNPVEQGFPAKIILGRNFRSRKEVTGAINFLFGLLMSKKLGEMDYGSEDRLTAGTVFLPDALPGCSLHLVDLSDDETGEEKGTIEARYVANMIKDILESDFKVEEKGTVRKISPSDIAILLRSPKGKSDAFVSELSALNIPAWSENQSGFLSSLEVSSVTAFLKILSNPLLDMELVQVLMSPIYAFSADDIARLRADKRRTAFYFLVKEAAESGNLKCGEFMEQFEMLRHEAALLPAHKLIKRLYDVTGFEQIARAMELGQVRLSNLRLLVDYAASYEEAGYKGLEGFVRFITRLEENGSDLSTAAARGGEAVSVMSIHSSKGLEFPVVILAACGRKFNMEDQRRNTMLSSKLGFACIRRDSRTMGQYTTLPIEAMRTENTRAMLSEELRILYVALTRARQRLYVTAAMGAPEKKIASLATVIENGKLSSWSVRSAGSFADWIIMAALHHKDGAVLRFLAGLEEYEPIEGEGSFEVVVAKPPILNESAEADACGRAPSDSVLLQRIKDRLSFEYEHKDSTLIPSKFAVSQLVHSEDGQAFSYTPRPAFLTEGGLTGAEKGTALHAFLQLADLTAALKNPQKEKARLVDNKLIAKEQEDAIDNKTVTGFLTSDLGKRIFAADFCYRELKFLCEAGSDLLGELVPEIMGDNKTLLQGVADCVLVEKDGAVIIDYKTDRCDNEEVLVRRYSKQLKLYAKIIEGWLGINVKECIIYSFKMQKAILIP